MQMQLRPVMMNVRLALALLSTATRSGVGTAEMIVIGSSSQGEFGWTDGVCYVPIDVRAGDVLRFDYGNHDVWRMASRARFDACDFADAVLLAGPLHSGPYEYAVGAADDAASDDGVYLACGIGGHCARGTQKVRLRRAAAGDDRADAARVSEVVVGLNGDRCARVQQGGDGGDATTGDATSRDGDAATTHPPAAPPACSTRQSCQDCLVGDGTAPSSCAYVSGAGCMDSCIADEACYAYDYSEGLDGRQICAMAVANEADAATCGTKSDCASCTAAVLLDGESSCQWFSDGGGSCGSECRWIGCGDTTCDAAGAAAPVGEEPVGEEPATLPIPATCVAEDDCSTQIRGRAPHPVLFAPNLCGCYAQSARDPFDECEGKPDQCMQAKCDAGVCIGRAAVCDMTAPGADGLGSCVLTHATATDATVAPVKEKPVGEEPPTVPISATCVAEDDCSTQIRGQAPHPVLFAPDLCGCYALSARDPFDECEGKPDRCMQAKCDAGVCIGRAAVCDTTVPGADGLGSCVLTNVTATDAAHVPTTKSEEVAGSSATKPTDAPDLTTNGTTVASETTATQLTEASDPATSEPADEPNPETMISSGIIFNRSITSLCTDIVLLSTLVSVW